VIIGLQSLPGRLFNITPLLQPREIQVRDEVSEKDPLQVGSLLDVTKCRPKSVNPESSEPMRNTTNPRHAQDFFSLVSVLVFAHDQLLLL